MQVNDICLSTTHHLKSTMYYCDKKSKYIVTVRFGYLFLSCSILETKNKVNKLVSQSSYNRFIVSCYLRANYYRHNIIRVDGIEHVYLNRLSPHASLLLF